MAHPSRKTHEESEQPAKVYQLDAVEIKVDAALEKLNTIITQTSGLVTPAQLAQSEVETEEKIKEAVKQIHLEYRPMKKNITWLLRTIVGQFIILIFSAIGAFIVWLTTR